MKGKTQIRRLVLLLLTALALVSCGKKVPPGILSKREMVQIMGELYINEEKVNQLALSRDSAKQVFGIISARLFEDAAVTDSAFRKSFDYYMERPQEMELIYTALVDTLQLREQRAPFRTDSQ